MRPWPPGPYSSTLPLRQMVMLPGNRNILAVMPAALEGTDGQHAIGAKVITVFPDNAATA